jgi:hypothetical protein
LPSLSRLLIDVSICRKILIKMNAMTSY